MTFIEALKIGRPIKRRAWPELVFNLSTQLSYWRWINPSLHQGQVSGWRETYTGELVCLAPGDYVAEDWEVMA